MNISAPFIRRPVATILLAIGLALAGASAFFLLPISPLPNVDIPVIVVTAQLPGASPETVATSVATPLERHLGTIADVTAMTSQSSVGQTRIILQFGVDRDINGAARDVQAAINAARIDLPAALRSNPSYRMFNPAAAPILILALTSDTLSAGQIYDAASTVIAQTLSQVTGVGEVDVNGASLPAVRVELNPKALFHYGIGFEDVRAALAAANANAPKGAIEQGTRRYQIYVNDTATTAAQFRSLIIAYRNNAAVRLRDVANVIDGVENIRSQGMVGGKSSVLVVIYRQPNASIIDVVDRIKAVLPTLQASIPPSITITPTNDRTVSIRGSLRDMETTMLSAVTLVVLVAFLFLRNGRAALVTSVVVPLSLLGTFGVMYLLRFSLNDLSLMAVTVATGFVVDDAVVVLENISRHIEQGSLAIKAAFLGAQEVAFTVIAMSVSLIAVFIPILFTSGLIGRFFREFSVTLSLAILFSLLLSLTVTPMMCAHIGLRPPDFRQSRLMRALEAGFNKALGIYASTLRWVLFNPLIVILILVATVGLNIYLLSIIPKGFFPQQDTGMIVGSMQADQSISFQLMQQKFAQFINILRSQPYIQTVVGFTGGGGGGFVGATNSGSIYVTLKPSSERQVSMDHVIADLRTQLAGIPGATVFLSPVQDLPSGGRPGNAAYQYTIQADELSDLTTWVPKITDALKNLPELEDVNSDLQQSSLDIQLKLDRNTAQRLGVNAAQIDNTLYDAFGQRQVSTIYNDFNQYHVVMEVAPEFWQSPETLKDIFVSTAGNINGTQATNAVAGTTVVSGIRAASSGQVAADAARNQAQNQIAQTTRGSASTGLAVSTSAETMVPLAAFSQFTPGTTPGSVNHQGPFVATTFSFNLPEKESLSVAVAAIQRTMDALLVPNSVHGSFAGNALAFQQALGDQRVLIIAMIATIYIVLGILYESYIHPLTIFSTLPPAGVGAFLALMMFGEEFSLIGFLGVILLIGIVKKNAIMMIDFALTVQRTQQINSRDAIYQACLMRFRPIMMTTTAAILAALPLAFITGDGAEMRRPLGISIVGGLLVSQLLTLYTTPVIYIYLDRFSAWCRRHWRYLFAGE
jgi:multidrug efflux pump